MTDQEKQEFLFKALEENGWKGIRNCSVDDERRVHFNYCIWTKNGVEISIFHYLEPEEKRLYISVNETGLFSITLRHCEVYSDHIEFRAFFGIDVMVRFSDAYVLMEYKPEEGDENNG